MRHIPFQRVKRCLEIVDHLDTVSRDILKNKKDALEKNDEAVLEQMDEGKDIMSVLRGFGVLL